MPTPVMVNSRSPIPVQATRMNRLEQRIADLDKQMATGEKFTEASQDPAAAARAAMLQRLQARIATDTTAINRASDRLALAESAIGNAIDLVTRGRDLALLAANGTSTDETRQIVLTEVKILQQQLLDAANVRDEGGRYLFAGSRSNAPAYGPDASGAIQWQGFAAAPGAEAAGIATASPPSGPILFGDGDANAFIRLQAFADALSEPDPELRSAALATALDDLQHMHDRLVTGQAGTGAAMARLENEGERLATAGLNVTEAIVRTKGLDLTQAITELQSLKLSLSAAQGSFATVFDGTLFDRLG